MSGHFGHWQKRVTTNTEWLPIAGAIGDLVNGWSGRRDLIVTAHEEAGRGRAAALFDPIEAKVEINTIQSFGKLTTPKEIGDLRLRKNQFRYAQGTGAAFHEASHAEFTTFDIKATYDHLTPSEQRALMNLEESRCEKHGIAKHPKMIPFLRACIMNMVMADTSDPKYQKLSQVRQAAHVIALTLARVDTGVLREKNVKSTREEIDAILEPDIQAAYRKLWLEYQDISNWKYGRNLERMYEIAREWDKITQDEAEKKGEGSEDGGADFIVVFMPGDGSGEDGDSDGDGEAGEDGQPGGPGGMIMAIFEDAKNTELDAQNEVNKQESQENADARAQAMKEKKQEKDQAIKAARKIFRGNERPSGATGSRLSNQRKPTTEERIAAITIAKWLDKARYRDRVKSETYNEMPPGRLKTRTIVTAAANKANGIVAKTEPFRRTRHVHVDDPNLTVGMMVDISGSMSSAMKPMGVAAWAMAEAVYRIQGKTAMVYYGESVFPTLSPGQRLPQINTYTAPDGYEKFDEAFQALNGALDLLNGRGARLLVIASDGQYRSPELIACAKWLNRCRQEGVGILWLGYGYSQDDGRPMTEAAGGHFVPAGQSIADDALAIGRAAAEALTKAGAGR